MTDEMSTCTDAPSNQPDRAKTPSLGPLPHPTVDPIDAVRSDDAPEGASRLAGIPAVDTFERLAGGKGFSALPDDWAVGVADVVNSTEAVANGRYKAVNMAGAASISAVMNAIGTRRFAFTFGGDGCAFALPAGDAHAARKALSDTAAFVRDEMALTLRVGLVAVGDLREAGADVRAAMYAPTPHVAYAMFDGGGVALAERWMKEGRIALPASEAGARPDLSGLSCRWLAMPARNGVILSVIVREGAGDFSAALGQILALVREGGNVHPVPAAGPPPAFFPRGATLEAQASRGARPLWRRRLEVMAHGAMGYAFFALGLKAGAFDAPVYRRLAGENADVRKLSDGLLLTLDATPELAARLEAMLSRYGDAGTLRFGLHRQDAALMTCIVPSYQDDGHFHFVDGAGGGYTVAARSMRGA